MAVNYAVIWRDASGPVCAGQLELLRHGFQLEGADRSGADSVEVVDADEICSIRIGRTPQDRVDGRSTLIVERSDGDCLMIASAIGIGMIHEIADQVGHLVTERTRA
jgi:hypothetical protein